MKVLVTPTSLCRDESHAALRRLRETVDVVVLNPTGRPLSADELVDLLPGVDGVVAGLDDYSARALAAADRLRVIARYGVGTDNVDLDAARARGVVVTRTRGANAVSVAELAIALTFAVARGIPRLDEQVRAGAWPRAEGVELTGRTFGVVGFGTIGRLVADRARGLGMRVVAHDPTVADAAITAAGVTPLGLDELCGVSDVLSLHVPLLPETRELIDGRRIALLPRDAIVVNTARGGLLDEHAARRALDAGHLLGVALDVYAAEPPGSSPLVGHPRTVLTAHSGGHTREAIGRMAEQAVTALLAVIGGQASPDAV